jgi:hypothetical protein
MMTKRNQTRMLAQTEKWLRNVQKRVSSANTADRRKTVGE